MNAEWIKSPTARRIFLHWADSRAAWLWSQDGSTLLWHNAAARLFNAKLKKSGLKVVPEAVPIKGQVARLIRLGAPGRASLSRVQFLSGDKPVAATCTCTPVELPDGELGLLLVCLDPIADDVRAAASELTLDQLSEALFPPGAGYVLVDRNRVLAGSPHAVATQQARIEIAGLPEESATVTRLVASPSGATLLVLAGAVPSPSIAEVHAEQVVTAEAEADRRDGDEDSAGMGEPLLPLGLEPLPALEPATPGSDDWVEPLPVAQPDRVLSSLFDRLAGDEGLYTTLTAEDETFAGPPPVAVEAPFVPLDEPPFAAEEPDAGREGPDPAALAVGPPYDGLVIAAIIEFADEVDDGTPAPPAHAADEAATGVISEPGDPLPEAPAQTHWTITGQGFHPAGQVAEDGGPLEQAATVAPSAPSATPPAPRPPAPFELVAVATIDQAPDAETAERVSRYNFEELGRILNDRVSGDAKPETSPLALPRPPSPEGVINLNAETLVLNRLPLAILVFRDQQVLFANRALTELLGHDSVESLRAAGIASVFPAEGVANAGPVNQLARRDGTLLPVTARLQSVSWQGRAALMLSASQTEPMRGHEGAVLAFAEIAAEARQDGFIAADRAGIVTEVSGQAAVLLAQPAAEITGKPLAILVGKRDMESLQAFLEKPARFAETTRPSLAASSADGETEIVLFAEGQAGVVSGYFGFLRRTTRSVSPAAAEEAIEPGLLGRLSRGIRRPLNTIIGFADLLRSAEPATIEPARAAEYAGDIRTAGLEIAVLVDELEDFTRLRDGSYAPQRADLDLQAFLEHCMVRVRTHAAAARVLVRSAISERLPRIRADRISLGQAMLNLLASAIDQTPVGGSVILSAQAGDDGSITIHVRDGAVTGADLGERFMVFRDGVDRDGEALTPVRSSVGLALTRSLLAINSCSLSVDPTVGVGTLFSMQIPAEAVVAAAE